MKASALAAFLWTLISAMPALAEESLTEYGPKRPLNDPRYAGVVLKSDIPENLSYLSSRPYPSPAYKISPMGGSADPRYLLFTPNLGEPPHDKKLAEHINLNSVVLSDYNAIAYLPNLREAWIITDKSEQLPQALLNALGTDRSLSRLIIRGDVSSLDLSVLGHDPQIKTITFHDSRLSLKNIDQLTAIKSLQCIEIYDSYELSAASVSRLVAFRNLRDLRLNCNLAANADVSTLRDLPLLQRLRVVVNNEDNIQQISKLTNLRVLEIAGPNIDAGLPHLCTLKNLISLELLDNARGMHLTGETLGELRYLPLKYLLVAGCTITANGYRAISEIKSLEGLDINWTKPPHDGLMALSNLHNLRKLDASCIGDYDQLKQLADTLPQCTIYAGNNCPSY